MAGLGNSAEAEDEESAILAGCRRGDAASFRLLYGRHFPSVHRLARRLGTPPEEVDDVTQEVFASAFGKLERFAGGNFGHWIHRICANTVTDHHRRRRVRETFRRLFRPGADEEPAREPSPESAVLRAQAERLVSQILSRMRPKQREVFALFELEGLSGEEIAARVECPVNTVWTRLHHAREDFVRIGKKHGWLDGVKVAR